MKLDEGNLIEMIDKRVGLHESRLERLALEESWITNVAFWSGKQRFYFEQGRLFDAGIDDPDEATHYKVNLIRSRVLAACAKVLAVNAQFRCRPPTGTARDRELSQLAERVFAHIREVSDFDWHLMMSTVWKAVCGRLLPQDPVGSLQGRARPVLPLRQPSPPRHPRADAHSRHPAGEGVDGPVRGLSPWRYLS